MSQARKEPIVNLRKVNLFSGLTAIASMGTLICCALPAFLVFIGAGSLQLFIASIFLYVTGFYFAFLI
ncbi:MAG: hypothetical protein ABS06_05320 [Methylophilales bacterium BACL14 MAG-120910-bin43]|jgi:hypothetical protein|nr:MAG: hypothetical protein ABS06_05320 [Methylophilales bacterium BACL14 MAG-120910-bin43]|tara:strand:- start:241 stop:444 length:204 start_codon:yes stop_codon:yes gene_type:complete